ncbi:MULTISPECIES: Ger(x)C family spore germination protein [Paenibacillus]|uniref:Ger(x)C family spore germination protein n=1 Tax=Paenibacillus TaxID=44249 RepID=UPI001B1B6042|nr:MULTISPECIES: Ger(x)C family spore germination protein [Paenibacillus]MCM3000277.1 Ger(x)C family spore germination protein [Paenibacillus cellulositrophicus]GIO61854.1 putative spore germination protein YfkR [Paenibacillus cineris]
MRNKCLGLLTVILLLLLLTGCWDRKELNDRLFEFGSGVDRLKGGEIMLIGQFLIPTNSKEGGGGGEKSYLIETGVGKTVSDCLYDMQLKLSRRITRTHRHNIYFGEEMAMAGISDLMDSVTRDPDSRLKSDMWVVKGGTALEFMEISYPLEKLPVIALSKLRNIIGKKTGNSLLELLIEEHVEGSGLTLPAVEVLYDPKQRKKTIHVYGRAVLNRKQQLAGYYDSMESAYRLWVTGQTNRVPVTVPISDEKETFSVDVRQTKCKIRTKFKHGRVEIDVDMKGSAVVLESVPAIDLRNIHHLNKFEAELNRHVETSILNVIKKAQHQFKVDVFNFGKAFNRQHPSEWTALKSGWEQAFSNAKITVHSNVKIKRIGLQGPPPNKP